MTDAKAVVSDILKADPIIRDIIANRKSIVPAGRLTGKSKYPAITIQGGPIVRREEYTDIVNIYIRAYDDPVNSTIYIDKIGNRLKQLLDHQTLELEQGVFVKCTFDSSLAELEDQALHKTFIEYHYTIATL